MTATTHPSAVEQPCDRSTDRGDLFVAYQPYSLDYLNRMRRGEVGVRPARLNGRAAS